jgi:uncharacterized protein YjbI with pentapeptide repeats
LIAFAETAKTLKSDLDGLRTKAMAFRAKIDGDDDWNALQVNIDQIKNVVAQGGGKMTPPGISDDGSKSRKVVHEWARDSAAASVLRAYIERLEQKEEARLEGSGLDFRGADLRGLPLRGASSAHLEGVSFREALLNRADFSEAFISHACFDDAEMMKADLFKVTGEHATFVNAWLSGLNALEANLRSADLHAAFLGGASFNGADLEGADLRGTKLERTFFMSSRLVNARVEGMNGTLIGPCKVGEDLELADADLQQWLRERGADVTVVPVNPT